MLAQVEGERFRRGGRASHLQPITRTDLERRYGYFLSCLSEMDRLDRKAGPAAQVTVCEVERFIMRVRGDWSPVTLAQSVYKLRRFAQIVSPEVDFSWLGEVEKDLALLAYPKDRFQRIVTTETLVQAGLRLFREAELATRRRPIWRASKMRDGLMVATLALHPIRAKNFAALELGRSFVREGDDWWIVLGRKDTKSKRPDERRVSDILRQPIARYLTWARQRLLRAPDDMLVGAEVSGMCQAGRAAQGSYAGPLWISQSGERLTPDGIAKRIAEVSRDMVGVTLSPHDFRSCAATTAAFHAGSEPHLASGLLQHTDRRVTDKHYNRASTMSAALQLRELVNGLRAR